MYDYLIIGAGSGGCALAGRLSEDPAVSVCLFETGGHDHNVKVWVPSGVALMLPLPNAQNYGYMTLPQPELSGRRGYQPRGRGLGGSSSLNAQLYIRGHRSDYDGWAAGGAPGWSWNEVLPYFKKAEHNERIKNDLHGQGGPLNVADLRADSKFTQYFVEAGVAAGYPRTDDFNGVTQEGVGIYQATQKNGERWNAARAYLHRGVAGQGENGGRANLSVKTGCKVLRIIFEGKRAVGVEVEHAPTEKDQAPVREIIRARREVILAAGAFGSPQLLMLSGIGPAAHLREHGVAVVHDLPGVGENLQDHLDHIQIRRFDTLDLVGLTPRGIFKILTQIFKYRRSRRGLIATTFAEGGAFIKSDPSLAAPDLQLHFCISMADAHGRKRNQGHGFSCHVCVLRPKSRGTVRLASADANVAPAIDPKFLSHPDDLAGLVKGFKVVRKIFAQTPLARFGAEPKYDGHIVGDGSDDDKIIEEIRARADTIYHPVGTCKMGTDAMAVVDPELRVYGVDGLRVVDASVMPTLIGGNTNAPTIMIAEKAADLIRRSEQMQRAA